MAVFTPNNSGNKKLWLSVLGLVLVLAVTATLLYLNRQSSEAADEPQETPTPVTGARLFFDPTNGNVDSDGTLTTDVKVSCDRPGITTIGATVSVPETLTFTGYSLGDEEPAANKVGVAPRSAFNMPVTAPKVVDGNKLVFAMVKSDGSVACQTTAAQVVRLTFKATGTLENPESAVLRFSRNGEMNPDGTGGSSVLTSTGENVLYEGEQGTPNGTYRLK